MTRKDDVDDSLLKEAERIFGDDLVEPVEASLDGVVWDDAPVLAPDAPPPPEPTWRPGRDKFTKVRGGGDYLGVRYRLLWMRAEHPSWTTKVVPHTIDWDAGIAIIVGQIYDETGRLIAEDMKTETRKDFGDFVEKACTGALGRALACAGYGTEGALELDEGVSERTGDLRIADAPVNAAPITITPSNIPGIKHGGRSGLITTAQLQAIARKSKELDLGPVGLAKLLDDEILVDELGAKKDQSEQQATLLTYLKAFTFDDAASLLSKLTEAA